MTQIRYLPIWVKMTPEAATQMRELFGTGKYTVPELAIKYEIHYSTAYNILSGKTWIEDYDPELKERNVARIRANRGGAHSSAGMRRAQQEGRLLNRKTGHRLKGLSDE